MTDLVLAPLDQKAIALRLICYLIIFPSFLISAASLFNEKNYPRTAVHLFICLFFLGSFFFALTKDFRISTWFTTPVTVGLGISIVFDMRARGLGLRRKKKVEVPGA